MAELRPLCSVARSPEAILLCYVACISFQGFQFIDLYQETHCNRPIRSHDQVVFDFIISLVPVSLQTSPSGLADLRSLSGEPRLQPD